MSDIEVRRAHALGLAGARRAADEMVAHLGREFALKGHWAGDTLHFDRPGVTGTLEVTASSLHLLVRLGFLLRMMKPSIEGAVHRELDALFARAHPAKKEAKPARPKKATGGKKKAG
jgi:putative polyhydroxyalkanoate system protein